MNILKPFLTIEEEISKKVTIAISVIGFFCLLTVWHLITVFTQIPSSLLPSPIDVILSFSELKNADLFSNMLFSLKLNVLGYIEAVLISVPLGFYMGLNPYFRSLVSKYFDAFRFLPLPAITGVFVAWFGIEISMKVHFLAFGIILYLVPTVVLRIDEIEKMHKQTMTTLGANKWQKIRHLYFPYAISKISDDIRVLVAISWTYIVIVELLNNQGGLGSMIFLAARQGYTEQIYALVLIIIALGYIQDMLLKFLDKEIFPFKYDGQVKRDSLIFK